ncbi:ECF transporter S component [Sinanaerobacter chloroacetimidivorans]|jgi:hypothetical protein|uniref:ECF transporter S component n=1 Tax=Sinanaerobacter chloroacetimidivorans TaxID=2818044 RepID=A0A8J8B207_9FIRM|nr:ECF transporter S component [Sinanaerobacter chloroacetimidivorans]MBR0599273.1 ECF transporter S component [Sinanaerobacter chloroacetimidivorans]
MKDKEKIFWITHTAIFIALLIVLQAATAPLGNVMITGTIVNLLLIVSAMTCGLASGLSVAVISPIIAKFFGIGPLWILIPFIAAGNIVLILLWYFIGNQNRGQKYIAYIVALATAAAAKFFVLYIGIVQVAVPLFLNLPEQQASIISHMFSIPQLITALAGGIIAAMILPSLKKAIKVS